jgi:putative GTP pyrophosphokinase
VKNENNCDNQFCATVNNPELEKEYSSIAPLCEQFGHELARQLEELLLEKNISLGFPLQCRVKKIDSILQKIERASLKVEHIQEISDLIGLRIILLFRRDVNAVRTLVKENFKVDSEEDTQDRLGESEFGYSSIHFQIGLLPGWKKMPTFKKSSEFRAEVQVRTVAQHIWAAASHIFQYKNEAGVPPPIRRSIHRVSALLETVDLEFERVLEERSKYLSRPKAKNSGEMLNVDLLAKILNETLPPENKHGTENYSALLHDLFEFSIHTESDLRKLVSQRLGTVLAEDKEVAKRGVPEDAPDTLKERVARGVYFSHSALIRRMLFFQFGKLWVNYRRQKTRRRQLMNLQTKN